MIRLVFWLVYESGTWDRLVKQWIVQIGCKLGFWELTYFYLIQTRSDQSSNVFIRRKYLLYIHNFDDDKELAWADRILCNNLKSYCYKITKGWFLKPLKISTKAQPEGFICFKVEFFPVMQLFGCLTCFLIMESRTF